MNNSDFAYFNETFNEACENTILGYDPDDKNKLFPKRLEPTTRQASKFRNQKGLAYKTFLKMKNSD